MRRVALISGSARRLGRAMACHLASKGWNLALHCHTSEAEAEALRTSLQRDHPDQAFVLFRVDLRDLAAVHTLIGEVIDALGRVDLLVNNASVFREAPVRETTIDLLEEMLLLHVKAPFILMRDFANRSGKGVIVNLTDTRITSNQFDFAAYTLSKKALWELTKAGAMEFAPGIRVNAIAPGLVLPPENRDEMYMAELARHIPMQRDGGITPVLKSLDYILDNDYLTGQLLFCDGGENLCSGKWMESMRHG